MDIINPLLDPQTYNSPGRFDAAIEAGFDVNARAELSGQTPLHLACGLAAHETLGRLMDAGADINARDFDGATPLWMACYTGTAWAVEALLAAGADPNVADHSRNTSLHVACAALHCEPAEALIEAGSDIDAQNDQGVAPLERALDFALASQLSTRGHSDLLRIVQACLQAGYDPYRKNVAGADVFECVADIEGADYCRQLLDTWRRRQAVQVSSAACSSLYPQI